MTADQAATGAAKLGPDQLAAVEQTLETALKAEDRETINYVWLELGPHQSEVRADLQTQARDCYRKNGASAGSRLIRAGRGAAERGAERINTGTAAEEWEEPLDLFRQLATRPYSTDDVPDVIGSYSASLARATGFDPTLIILPMVTAAAAAVDDRIRLSIAQRSKWYESARIWSLAIAGPAAGKTPAMRATLKPMQDVASAQIAKWRTENSSLKDEDRAPMPRLLTYDTTIEALADVLRDNPRGLLCVAEEFDSWIGSHDCYRSGQGSRDRGEWLRLFDGGPNTVDRVKRGAMYIQNWGASICASTTPAALKRHARNLPIDGLLQRFIVGVAGRRAKPCDSMMQVEVTTPREAFEQRIRDLIEKYGAPDGVTVRMSHEARAIFEAEEQALIETTDAAESLAPAFAAHIGKHAAMIARVALTFHAIAGSGHPGDAELGADSMRLAIRFMRRARQHGASLYGSLFENRNDGASIARSLARSILASNSASINKRKARAICRDFRDAEIRTQEQALLALTDSGWLRPEFGTLIPPYGATWTVNPRAMERFAAVGEEHARRRAAVREILTGGNDD